MNGINTIPITKFESLRPVLAEHLRSSSDEQIEQLLAGAGLDAEGIENLFGTLANLGGQVVQGFQSPQIQAGLRGAAGGGATGLIGGPLGAGVGAGLGFLGGLLGSPGSAGPAPAPGRPGAAPVPALPTTHAPLTGPAQLLALLAQPQVLQSLVAMMLGSTGARSVPVGGVPVPVGQVASTIGTVAAHAASEYNSLVYPEGEGEALYMYGTDRDPADPQDRAARVLELFAADAASAADSAHPRRPRRRQVSEGVEPEWAPLVEYDPVYDG